MAQIANVHVGQAALAMQAQARSTRTPHEAQGAQVRSPPAVTCSQHHHPVSNVVPGQRLAEPHEASSQPIKHWVQ